MTDAAGGAANAHSSGSIVDRCSAVKSVPGSQSKGSGCTLSDLVLEKL